MATALPAAREMFADADSSVALAERFDALVKASTESTVASLSGETYFAGSHEGTNAIMVAHKSDKRDAVRRALADLEVAKGVDPAVMASLESALTGSKAELLSKEWTLANPLSTGLVPFDLEAPAKLLTPRPTPLRNSIPRVKGQGSSRRFKVISGFTGTGTGGVGTLQPGINESTTNAGPGGLSYVRPSYISYNGYDVNLPYVSWGLSDSVSWQAEYEGQGFQDIRSLSNTALLYATMLIDERLMLYGRGSLSGYAGALGTPVVSLSAVAASVAGAGTTSSLLTQTYWVVVAADGGDLLGTTGAMHQGPTTAAASVAVTAGQAIQASVTTDVAQALGYNLFIASASAGPFFYAGRTGYNTGFVTSAPVTGNSVAGGAGDASAVATNFDGLLTNVAASGGYVKRLNTTFSTSAPGIEYQTAFSSLFDAVKADPDEIWMNGHDRNQLSNALFTGGNNNNYRVYIPDSAVGGVKIGALVQSITNQITGKELDLNVHPWMPQGNSLVRSRTLPIPDTNVTETSVMALVQDYVGVQWPVVQYTYDASTLQIGTFAHYAPSWNAILQGIQQNG